MSNLEYWGRELGEDYRQQHEMRLCGSGTQYDQQEIWLEGLLSDLSTNSNKAAIRLLDYGCGFGRMANVASEFKSVDYFGFDISVSMTAALLTNPPERFQSDITERVRVADRLGDAFAADDKFDVVLTVSVLIHNRPAFVKKIIATLLDRLTPDGMLVLIENPHTAVSALQNFWHGGCWCHSMVRYFDGLADVEIIDNFAGQHAIYLARCPAVPSVGHFVYRASPEAVAEHLDLQAVLLKGLDRAAINADELVSEWSAMGQDHAALVGRVHDLEERLAHQNLMLSNELSEMRTHFAERQRLQEDLAFAVNQTKVRFESAPDHGGGMGNDQSTPSDHVEWNALQDTRYSHELPGFENVLHVFHKEWFGIRAAAGSLPGAKLAIPANVDLGHSRVLEIYDAVLRSDYQRIVFHGISKNATKLIEFFYKRGLAEIVYAVKHGSPTQWIAAPERRAAFAIIEQLRSSKIRRLHFMKEGFRFPVDGLFQPMLFNLSPKLGAEATFRRHDDLFENAVFVPGWDVFHKNLYTNVVAAAMSERVRSVLCYADALELPSPLSGKLRPQPHSTREFTFQLMARSSLCMNVSLVDCHPMVNLEAQRIGCPCLRGDLHLDALEDHPYITLTNVRDATSVAEILDKIERVLSVPAAEMEAMILDYQTKSDEVGRNRYLEFLEL